LSIGFTQIGLHLLTKTSRRGSVPEQQSFPGNVVKFIPQMQLQSVRTLRLAFVIGNRAV
jgi:hypothetical protein